MKIKFGSFEVSGLKIHFAYEGKNIWINVGNMSDLIAGGANMGASADFLVMDAEKRSPELTKEMAVKLPYITKSGAPSEEYQWYYRIDLDLRVFGLQAEKITIVENDIHQPLRFGLKDELV